MNGENVYYQIHDNLDSNVAWFKMLRDSGAWFSRGATVPFLGGINRNYLCSEFKFYSWIHIVFPTFAAFVFGDVFRTVFAVASGVFLGRVVLKDSFSGYKHFVVLCSFLYGILPTYPTACLDFASMPLVLAFSIVFKEMHGRYVFSRVDIENASDLDLNCKGVYSGKEFGSPYTIRVYEVAK